MRLNAAFWLRLGWSVQLLLAVALGVATLASLTPGKAAEPSQAAQANKPAPSEPLVLHARTRVETAPGTGRYHTVTKELAFKPAETAVVICDMWDRHWCPAATQRVAEMAPRMNEVVKAAREMGMLIIHCPSDTMDYYRDHPGRKLAQQAPPVETKIPLQQWCSLDKEREGTLPIDDSDNGCDCDPSPESHRAWTRQIDTIEIKEGDAITDNAEAFYLMKQRGITNVIVMGVHTNMCVLGRPFGIRQLVRQGQNVVLVRDLTDTMYNPKRRPFVSHFTGNDLVIEHVERHWCPTITSADIAGGKPFRFAADRRPHVAIVMAEDEYRTEETLPKFALQELGKEFQVSLVFGDEKDRTNIPGLEVLNEADVLLVSVRRRSLKKEQLDIIRKFVADGKAVVGIRTASHAFALRDNSNLPAGTDVWPEFDAEVLGGNYQFHHKVGPDVVLSLAEKAAGHPILRGVAPAEFVSFSSLYLNSPLRPGAQPLLIGTIPDKTPEPVAWTHTSPGGGRVFYTSLGGVKDFEQPQFRRFLANGIRWVAGLDVNPEPEAAVQNCQSEAAVGK